MQLLKQSTAGNVPLKVYLSTDHLSAATGKTLAVTLSKDCAAFGALGGAVTEISSGWYKVALNTTDTAALGTLVVRATSAGCDDAEVVCQVVADLPGATVSSVTGSVGSVTGAVGSVTAGVTVTTNNDKTGYALTQGFPANFAALGITAGGHVSNVDTLTTYTGNTVQTGDNFARLGAPTGASIAADIQTRSTYAGGAVASVTAGVTVAAAGLNAVLVGGFALPLALDYIGASAAGKVSGAGTGTEVFKSIDGSTTRLTVTCDTNGNRTGITYG